jgi:hypothetical protein
VRLTLTPNGSGPVRGKVSVPTIAAMVAVAVVVQSAAAKPPASFVGRFHKIKTVASTVPSNGDVNPYGVAVAPVTKGRLVKGDVLISNFNNKKNLQGTGKTITEISPSGKVSLFASLQANKLAGACPGGLGLTTALVALRSGWVVVGSLPTKDGSSKTAKAGCLIVLSSSGKPVKTIAGKPVNGPWDMTALDRGGSADLFVTNVLDGTVAASPKTVNRGTVVRIDLTNLDGHSPTVHSKTVIGRGFPERTDPAALVVGPTGLGLSGTTLYVADSAANRIAAIAHATTTSTASHAGKTVATGGALNTPLGLTIAPGGDVLTVNGGDGKLVETSPAGKQVAVKVLDNTKVSGEPNGNGTLFGLAVVPGGTGVYFVDDGSNTLDLFH